MLKKYSRLRDRRRAKTRAKIRGTNERPRLSVFRSNRHLFAQLVDDGRGLTLVSASDQDAELKKDKKQKTKTKIAYQVGLSLAKKAKKAKISKAVFDRSGYKYHGRIKALAEGVRKEGIKI